MDEGERGVREREYDYGLVVTWRSASTFPKACGGWGDAESDRPGAPSRGPVLFKVK